MNFTYKNFILHFVFVICIFLEFSDARQCYTCTGINCLRPTKTDVKTSCLDSMDSCVTIFDDLTVLAKGCYSSIAENLRTSCDGDDNTKCIKCFGELCNNKGPIKCVQCSSSNDKQCSSDPSSLDAAQCSIPTAANSYCYVRQTTSNVIERGCLVDNEKQLNCLNDALCSMCIPSPHGEPCNREEMMSHIIESSATGNQFAILLLPLAFIFLILFK